MAHAWVEYYDTVTRAWCILEATPVYVATEKPEVVPDNSEGGTIPGQPVAPGEDIPVDDVPDEDAPAVDIPEEELPEEELPEEELPTEELPEEEPPTEDIPTDPTTVPEETEAPEASAGDTAPQKQGGIPRHLRKWIMIGIYCLLFVLGVLLQGYVRIFRKRKLWNRGNPNEMAIWRWRQTRRVAKLLNQYYPVELDGLAKKARFSQHEMQPDELQLFEDHRLALVDVLAAKPWYQRMFFKWILAIDCK